MDNTQSSQQGPSGLDEYISRVEPQPANVDDLLAVNERDKEVRAGGNDGGIPNAAAGAGNADAARLTNQQAGMGGQDEASLRIAEAERRAAEAEQVARKAAADRVEAQQQAFEASIANLPDDEKAWYRTQRELQQTRMVNSWLGTKLQSQEQGQAQMHQENAKRVTGLLVAQQAGLPQHPDIQAVLLTASDLPDMQRKAQNLRQMLGQNQAQNVRQIQQSGGFAAGGQVGQSAPAAQPKKYSGDISGLIKSRSYQFVPDR